MTYPRPAQGRQPKIGVTFLAWINIYQNLKQLVQDAVAPEMQALKSDIKGLSQRIDSLERKTDELRLELRGDVQRMEARMEKRLDSLERQVEKAIDIHERLAALEARLAPRKPN